VQVDQVPANPKAATDYLKAGRPPKRPDTLLLESVEEGPLSLYTKQGRRDRYYVEGDEEIIELVERTRYLEAQDAMFTSHQYRQHLTNRMEPCPEVQDDVGGTALKLRPLKELVSRYNQCVTGASSSFVAEGRTEWDAQFGLVGGLVGSKAYTKGTLAIDGALAIDGVPYDPTMGYRGGGWVRLRSGDGQGHWAVQGQLLYVRNRARGSGPIQLGTSGRIEMRLDHRALRLTATPRYYFHGQAWEPYLEGGMAFTYSLDVEPRYTVRYPNTGQTVSNRTLPDDYRGAAYGAVVGGGVQYRAFTIGGRLEFHHGFSFNYESWVFSRRSIGVSMSLGYQL
jgi:hypothetical protein